MDQRRRVVLAVILLAGVTLAGGALWLGIRAGRQFSDPRYLLSRFPAEDAFVLSADFAVLRKAGLLADSKTPLEPDYKQFLDGTGFDYRRDLDFVIVSLSASGNFFIARGRFDWNKLRDYATRQGGSCYQQLCRMPGSTPERHISFLPLRSDTIAMAVGANDLEATRLTKAGDPVKTPLPSAPVWLSVPGAELRKQGALPPRLRLMLSTLANADRIVVALGPSAQGIEAHLEANCRTADEAKILASQLRVATTALKEAVGKDKEAQNDELIGMLAAGSFDQTGVKVTGNWPVKKGLLDALTAGL
jgi:hypothetical protein